jgi:hypothetical protein
MIKDSELLVQDTSISWQINSKLGRGDHVMRIIGILALVLTLAACTGDRLRQSSTEQPQVVVARGGRAGV